MNSPASTPAPVPTSAPAAHPVQEARNLIKTLQERYVVFRECRPLAIGIDKQIIAQEPEISRKVLRIALGIHTRSTPYLKVMEKATVRFNLDGNNADEVPEEHRKHAAEMLRERFKKVAEQRKAQRKVQLDAQREATVAEEAERRRSEKLNALAAKFSRKG